MKRFLLSLTAVLAFFLAVNVVFLYYPPDQLVSWVGVQNTNLAIFLIAAIGGVNTFTSGVLYASLLAFASGGADPLWLGVACGLGIALGDSIVFYLFRYGTKTLPESLEQKVLSWKDRISSFPRWVQYSVIFAYLAFSPFPNDILLFILATLRFKFRNLIALFIVGGIVFATIAAYVGQWW